MSDRCEKQVKFLKLCVGSLVGTLVAIVLFANRDWINKPDRGDCFFNEDQHAISKVEVVYEGIVYYSLLSIEDSDIVDTTKKRSISSFNKVYPISTSCALYNILENLTVSYNGLRDRHKILVNFVSNAGDRLKLLEELAVLPILEKDKTNE